jgi:hypothetical protein
MIGIERRLQPLRGRLALSRSLEDLQRGIPAGAAVAALLGLLRWTDLVALEPGVAVGAGVVAALLFPAAGALLRRPSSARLASLVDERLGLAERVGTALALRSGEAPATPLEGLVEEDARASLDRVPPAALRRAFRPTLLPRPLAAAALLAAASAILLRAEPWKPSEPEKDPVVAYREEQERKEAAKAARRALEAAKQVEETADPRQAALRAVAAEMRRRSEEMLRAPPPRAEAMASFQKMGETVRERMEMLAGVDEATRAEWKRDGLLGKRDGDLEKLLSKLLQADLSSLNESLADLDASLKGAEGGTEWTAESLAALQARLDELAAALEKSEGALGDRQGLREGLQALGNAALLRELSERMGKLMKTLQEQGWEACRNAGGLDDGSMDFEPGEPIYLTDLQLQAMIERLKELQSMADLGRIASCQSCGLSGGGT